MGTEVLKMVGSLESQLEKARSSLKDFDENIKRLIGRDPSESVRPNNNKRPQSGNQAEEYRGRYNDNANRFTENTVGRYAENTSSRQQRNQYRAQVHENGEPAAKRRGVESVFKRLDKPRYEDEDYLKPQMHSRVIVTPREVPSRQEALAAQDRDEKSKARNRRMFGALIGTLQKFRQEETKLKTKEEKRAQVEKKLEEQEILEKARLKKERYALFVGRKRKQQEIRVIEQKMQRMRELTNWEQSQKPLVNFIQTKSKPHIFYLPRRMNDKTKEKLNESRKMIEKTIDTKQKEVQDELETIEKRLKNTQQSKDNDKEDHEIDETDEIAHTLLEDEDEMPIVENTISSTELLNEHPDLSTERGTVEANETENGQEEMIASEMDNLQVTAEETQEHAEVTVKEEEPTNNQVPEKEDVKEKTELKMAEHTDLIPSDNVDSDIKTDNQSAPS